MLVPGRSGTTTLGIPLLLGAKAVWTCLYSIIQHHLGSLTGPPLHKNCFMLSLHENKFFGFEWEWPSRRRLPPEASPMIAHHELGAHLDEHGAWRRAVVRRLDLGAGIRPPRLVAGSCLQQHRERLGPGEGGNGGRLPPGHSGRLQASH